MIETPQIVDTTAVNYAFVRRTIPCSDISKVMSPAIQQVIAELLKQKRKPNGAWFTHHLRRPVDYFDFEVCFPVESPIEPAGEVLPGVWPAMKVARTVYNGDYSGLAAAWGEFEGWMKEQGHQGGAEFWERYTISPPAETTAENWRTELNWPLVI